MAALALVAAGCGPTQAQPGSPGGGSSSSSGSADVQALAYANCMRTHGVPTWPDPNSGGTFDKGRLTSQQLGVSSTQLQAAQRSCQSLFPNGPSAGPTAAQVQQYRSSMLQYARCMRAHGISDVPDPNSRGHINWPTNPAEANSPQVQAARQVCLSRLSS